MRKFLSGMVLLLIIAATLQQCTDAGEDAAGVQKVQFTFSYKGSNTGGRVQQDIVPNALLLSLEQTPGNPLFISKRINLLHVGESYITEPIEITPGSYTITDFMLAAGDSVVYLTPLAGSPLSKAVNHPLPYPLVVNKDQATTVDMEVIAIGTNPPEDFGYASFTINTVNPFRISVFAGTTLTNATAYILKGPDTIKTQNLDASINFLSFPGDPHGLHKLIVSKPGYSTFIQPFYYDELIASLHGLPLKAMLEPALFTIHPAAATYSMRLMGNPGTLNIDWGDGAHETFTLGQDTLATHTYPFPGCCPVNITGDLDKVISLYINSDLDNINVQGLSGLGDFRMQNIPGPAVVDFTHNFSIFYVWMPGITRLKQMILPPASLFQSYMVNISAPNQIATADVDAVIERAYFQAINYWGSLTLNDPSSPSGFVGPPSSAGMDKLRILRDVHHWEIIPNPN